MHVKNPWKLRQTQLIDEKQNISEWMSKHIKPDDIPNLTQQVQKSE